MDENSNKDFLDQEKESEKEITSAEDTNSLNNDSAEGSQLPTYTEGVQTTKVKSKRFIQTPLIIAGAILVAALLAFGAWKIFFDNTIVGTWVVEDSVATSDEATTDEAVRNSNTYYTFTDKTNEDGEKIATLSVGTMELSGTYSVTNDTDGTQTLTVSISYFFAGDYTFNVTGNAITGRILTLTSASATDDGQTSSINFLSAQKPTLKTPVSKDFKVKDEIVGEWNESTYGITYTFNEDGTAHVDEGGTLTVDGTYTVSDDKITITYLTNQETSLELEYSFDGDTLILSGLGYTKVENK